MQINPLCSTTSLYNLISNINPGTNHVPKIYVDMEQICLTLLPNAKPREIFRHLPREHDAICLIWDMA